MKFNKKAIAAYGKAQNAQGTPNVPSAVDALAILDFSYKDTITNETLAYAGDETSRDELNYYTDWYAEATGTIIVPARPTGTISAATDLKLYPWFGAAGANVLLSGSSPNQVFTITNDNILAATTPAGSLVFAATAVGATTVTGTGTSFAATDIGKVIIADGKQTQITGYTDSTHINVYISTALTTGSFANGAWKLSAATANVFLTTQIRLASPDLVGGVQQNKMFQIDDGRVGMDLDLEVGKKAKLKVAIKGSLNANSPAMVTPYVPIYGTEKTLGILAPLLQDKTIICCELTGKVGGYTTHTGDAGTVKNIALQKISATNIFGYQLDRFQTAIDSGFDRTAIASDFTITIREDQDQVAGSESSSTNFDPYNHIGDAMEFTIKYGNATGRYFTLYCSNLQLTDVSRTTVGQSNGLDLKFRNAGSTTIKIS